MISWVERKYTRLLSGRLRNFKEHRNTWQFSCPYCGDSKSNPLKARAYLFETDKGLKLWCHNCNQSAWFGQFLKMMDPLLYREYVMERFTSDKSKLDNRLIPVQETIPVLSEPRLVPPQVLTIGCLRDLDKDNPAVLYAQSRKIPTGVWADLFYAPDFKSFMDGSYPNHGKELDNNDPRLVWFMTNITGHLTHVCGRTINGSSLRYIKIKVDSEDKSRKVFGLNHIQDTKSPVFIVEGELDSLFIQNCVSPGDSALEQLGEELTKTGLNVTLAWDNEPRNSQIVNDMKHAIKHGYNVVIWNDELQGKDINEAVLNGMLPIQIQQLMVSRSFNGLTAELMFNEWRI